MVARNIAPTIGGLLTATLFTGGPVLIPHEAPACRIPRGGPHLARENVRDRLILKEDDFAEAF